MPLGLYLSVPFCKTKCSFCNFASGVFSREIFDKYIRQVTGDIERAESISRESGGTFEREVDSIYLGGGTPSVLAPEQLRELFAAVRANFEVQRFSEITVECAPGTLDPELIDALLKCGVNRVSLGLQSWVDEESRAVGRLHTREIALADIARLREAGLTEISLDLIAGLPHQTMDSWQRSLEETIAAEVPHVSVYMLEVDEDSRLGRELIAGGTRYHAHHVPDDDLTADMYIAACARLGAAGLQQYEISNFARDKKTEDDEGEENEHGFPAHASLHNLKYWLRQPYLGFGVDAHSMLLAPRRGESHAAVRLATADSLDALLAGAPRTRTLVDESAAIEEAWFLGLRLNRGVEMPYMAEEFGIDSIERYREQIVEMEEAKLLSLEDGYMRLTERGRLLSNEVFARFIQSGAEPNGKNESAPPLTQIRVQ